MADNRVAIDRGDLDRKLADVAEYLAELRYIDLALQYIIDRNHQYAEAGVGQPGLGSSWWITVELGTHYPFASQGILAPTTVSAQHELQPFDALAEQASQWAANEMSVLTRRIRDIMYYPINGYNPMDRQLERVWTALDSEVRTDFGFLKGNISRWSGTAANEFRVLFYGNYEEVRHHQRAYVRALQGALEASRRSVEYAQQSVINAVTSAREALLEQLYLRSVGGSGPSSRTALLVVAGSFTVLTALVGGSMWAAALGGAAFAANVAASELPPDGTEGRDIEGGSAEEFFISLFDAIREVDAYLNKDLDYLHDQLRHMRTKVEGLKDDYLMHPKRPRIADGVSSDDFYHNSSQQYP